MSGPIPVARGCGERYGGIYLGCGLSPFGLPWNYFIVDPPLPIPEKDSLMIFPPDTEPVSLQKRGQLLFQVNPDKEDEPYHVLDWIGEEHYPNVTDMLEEAQRFGVSRRANDNLDFSKLSKGSRLLLVHRRAFILEPDGGEGWLRKNYETWKCPLPEKKDSRGILPPLEEVLAIKERHKPENFQQLIDGESADFCAGLWWEDILDGTLIALTEVDKDNGDEQELKEVNPRSVMRSMPSFTYWGRSQPELEEPPIYIPAVFASFPITQVDVVKDKNKGEEADEKRVNAANQQKDIPVVVCEE
jgi:hypothetical protein